MTPEQRKEVADKSWGQDQLTPERIAVGTEHTSNAPHQSNESHLYRELCEAKRLLALTEGRALDAERQRDAALAERDRYLAVAQAAVRQGEATANRLRHERDRLRDALQSLYDAQNGPPLLGRHEKFWNDAMAASKAALVGTPESSATVALDRLRAAARAFLDVLDRTTFSAVALRGPEMDRLREACK